MPLRTDAGLWWNLPGVAAAYQPVRAPGPLLARYNMAHGGDNRYRATDGTPPTWSAVLGWTFDGATQYLKSGVNPTTGFSMLVRFSGAAAGGHIIGRRTGPTNNEFGLLPITSNGATRAYRYAAVNSQVNAVPTSGVMGVVGLDRFFDGRAESEGEALSGTLSGTLDIWIGCTNSNGSAASFGKGNALAIFLAARTLTPVEVWSVSRQMAYCDVNPDWSVWGRRRQWFYGPQVGGFQAAWARNANSVLQVGR